MFLESEGNRLAPPLFTVWEKHGYASREQVNYQENSRFFFGILQYSGSVETLRCITNEIQCPRVHDPFQVTGRIL